jgi:hypothetical protein
MEKLIALNETAAVRKRECNKAACGGCELKNEHPKPVVAKDAGENNVNILQLYYAALIQCYTSQAFKVSQGAGYLHCT